MALIKCPECGKEISDKASACIHCGYPIVVSNNNNEAMELRQENDIECSCTSNEKQNSKSKILLIGVIIAIIIVILILVGGSKDDSNTNVETDSKQTKNQEISDEEAIDFATSFFGRKVDENGKLDISDEEYQEIISDYELFGYAGKFTHGLTSKGYELLTIDMVDWTSNGIVDGLALIIEPLIELYGEDYRIGSYDDSPNSAYIWERIGNYAHIICWQENDGTVIIRWISNQTEFIETLAGEEITTKDTGEENTSQDDINMCIVNGCNNEGTIPVVGITNRIEHYCQTHFDEIEEFQDKMEQDVGQSSASKHTCFTDGCTKEGTNCVGGLNGNEYYCTEHYNEMLMLMEKILSE